MTGGFYFGLAILDFGLEEALDKLGGLA